MAGSAVLQGRVARMISGFDPRLLLPFLLSMILPLPSRADIPCVPPNTLTQVNYEGDTLPQDDPVTPWKFNVVGDATARVENGILIVEASSPGAGILYGRDEPSLTSAPSYAIEGRMWFTNMVIPPSGTTAGISVVDSEKEVSLHFQDSTNHRVVLEVGTGVRPEYPVDFTQPHDYRVEVVRHQNAVVYLDGVEIFDVAYADLPDVSSSPTSGILLAGFFGYESVSYWDYVRYTICALPPPETRLPLGVQLETLKNEALQLTAPTFVQSWIRSLLDQVASIGDPAEQGQAIYQIELDVFVLKFVGFVRDDAARLETLLDFARTTVIPDSNRLAGYLGRTNIKSFTPIEVQVIPGIQDARVSVAVDIIPALSQVFGYLLWHHVVLARAGIVEVSTGTVITTTTKIVELPDGLPLGQTYHMPSFEITWNGTRNDGTIADNANYFFDFSVEYVRLNRFTGRVAGYIDQGGGAIPLPPPVFTNPMLKLVTDVTYPGYSGLRCGSSMPCRAPFTCSYDLDPCLDGSCSTPHPRYGSCVLGCSQDLDCQARLGPDWWCWGANEPLMQGYCYLNLYASDCQSEHGMTIYNGYGGDPAYQYWAAPAYSVHTRFWDLKRDMDEIIKFHYSDLRRNSYDGHGGPYDVELMPDCCRCSQCTGCTPQRGSFGKDCEGEACNILASSLAGGLVKIWKWSSLGQTDLPSRSEIFHMLSHEYGHKILDALNLSSILVTYDTLDEDIPDMYGTLMTAKPGILANQPVIWKLNNCINFRWENENSTATMSPWMDDRDGIFTAASGCGNLPYAYRSRFDWVPAGLPEWEGYSCESTSDCPPFRVCDVGVSKCEGLTCASTYDCPPYQVCDPGEFRCRLMRVDGKTVWSRFLRVLAEGTDTFLGDGHGEDVGVHFNGIGWLQAAQLTDVGIQLLANETGPRNLKLFVKDLRGAGILRSAYQQVVTALGIIGFISETKQLVTHTTNPPDVSDTNASPYMYSFSSWQRSADKIFFAWKLVNGHDIVVRYQDDTRGTVSDTISADTDLGPTLVEYHEKLYVFWKNRTTNSIEYITYAPDGTIQGSIGQGPSGVIPDGSLDAVVFSDRLYLAYTDRSEVSLSWCTGTGTDCSWHQFDDGSFRKGLGTYGIFNSVAVDAGPALHGCRCPDTSYLYIAYQHMPSSTSGWDYENFGRIKIDQVDATDVIQYNTIWIPSYYPSFHGTAEVGLRMVKSAFPEAGNYLYLVWKDWDPNNPRIFKSVITFWDTTTYYYPNFPGPDMWSQRTPYERYWFTWSDDTFLESTQGVRLMKAKDVAKDGVVIVHTGQEGHLNYSPIYGLY